MSPSRSAVLFDLGNTLAAYYRPAAFGPVLEAAVRSVLEELHRRQLSGISFDTAIASAWEENREASDFRFRPMEERLRRVFALATDTDPELLGALCARFLEPIFSLGRVYDDALPALTQLRAAGYATAIVSNAPWGSPPALWHDELRRLGLAGAVDRVVMCGDVGWRKPAAQIFLHAATQLGIPCERCTFVGDEPPWDIDGSAAVGMRPILIDRGDLHTEHRGVRVRTLAELQQQLAIRRVLV